MIEHSGRGGMYAYADSLCNALSEAGADVTVLTSTAWPEKQVPFKVERKLSEFTRQQGGGSKLHWAADRICRSLLNSFRRNRFILDGNFDIVHFQGAGMPLLDQFFFKQLAKKLPVVLTVHDIRSHYERFVSRDSFLRRSLQIPHCLITHYQSGKNQLIEHWGVESERISVIPHGIMEPMHRDVTRIEAKRKLDLPEDRKVLLFFGSIRPNKGLEVLLEALNYIRSKVPEVLLIVAGAVPRGMSFQSYSDIIRNLNLSENVRTVIDFIPDEDVDCFMAAADVVVLPYLKFEAQSGVLLRAYAHKKPVVVSNVGAMGELVSSDKVGLTVEPGAAKDLAEAVADVLKNHNEFQSYYTAELENKYNWKSIAELTVHSYEKAIAISKKCRNG
ncbi:MAG: glycosyltransferase family 4 protein [Sedimentisphaerales bacterium]|nr:glycosyltransferase family 4 protein [Sedimentisphaerales bacterium]